jgi:hypothetical protein
MRVYSRRSRLFACLVAASFGSAGLAIDAAMQPAHAQDTFAGDFHEALAPYGQWVPHPRWGEVWIPMNVPPEWAPYRYGHWVYTDEWGWYWVSDEDFGWITFHYGRWVPDRQFGWVWVPSDEWSPAWVSWRRGEEAVGWAPMPPDEVIDEYEESPDVWCFVRPHEIFAPRVAFVAFQRPQVTVFLRQTVVVNRTVFVRQGGVRAFANPGIPPSFIAARIGRPIQTSVVQPHVLRGTVGVAGAVVGAAVVGAAVHESVRAHNTVIQPATSVPPPTRFQAGRVDLGPDAPNALKRTASPGSAPSGPTAPQGNIQLHQQGAIQQQGGPPPGGPGPQGNIQPRQQDTIRQQGGPPPQGNFERREERRGPPPGGPPPGPPPSQQSLQHQPQPEFHRPPPPPPPVVSRPPPPPPPVVNRPPPPPVQAAKPPPPPAQAAKPAGKKCEKGPNGQEVCH